MKFNLGELDKVFGFEYEERWVEIEPSQDDYFVPWNVGIPHTEESKKLMSDRKLGNQHAKGAKHSQEMNEAKSKAMTGKRRGPYKPRKTGLSEEAKQKHREVAQRQQRNARGRFHK